MTSTPPPAPSSPGTWSPSGTEPTNVPAPAHRRGRRSETEGIMKQKQSWFQLYPESNRASNLSIAGGAVKLLSILLLQHAAQPHGLSGFQGRSRFPGKRRCAEQLVIPRHHSVWVIDAETDNGFYPHIAVITLPVDLHAKIEPFLFTGIFFCAHQGQACTNGDGALHNCSCIGSCRTKHRAGNSHRCADLPISAAKVWDALGRRKISFCPGRILRAVPAAVLPCGIQFCAEMCPFGYRSQLFCG